MIGVTLSGYLRSVSVGRLTTHLLADAWAWLEAHALIGPHAQNTTSSWQQVTEAGRDLATNPAAVARVWAEERLAVALDPALNDKVRPIFNVGDYETACFAAMKTVEVEVRKASGLDASVIGVDLMRQAFKPDGGPLTDKQAHPGERVAVMELFAGSIGAFKDPPSHRRRRGSRRDRPIGRLVVKAAAPR